MRSSGIDGNRGEKSTFIRTGSYWITGMKGKKKCRVGPGKPDRGKLSRNTGEINPATESGKGQDVTWWKKWELSVKQKENEVGGLTRGEKESRT